MKCQKGRRSRMRSTSRVDTATRLWHGKPSGLLTNKQLRSPTATMKKIYAARSRSSSRWAPVRRRAWSQNAFARSAFERSPADRGRAPSTILPA